MAMNKIVDTCCGLHPVSVTGSGCTDRGGVVILGIAAGREEIKKRDVFVGPAGQLLNATLEAAGWSRDKVFCTNLCCFNNDEPTLEEITLCGPRLSAELNILQPKLLITLGSIVTNYITGYPKIGKVRGVPLYKNNSWAEYTMPTYHPSAVLRGQHGMIYDILRDLTKIPAILNYQGPPPKPNYTVVSSPVQAQVVLNSFKPGDLVALDIETSNKDIEQIDAYVDKFLCLALQNGSNTYVFPADVCTDLKWPEDIKWLFHYGQFDTVGLRKYFGISLPICEDTLLASYALDERSGRQSGIAGGIHRLKPNVREYCRAGFYEENVHRNSLESDEVDKLHEYNACDAYFTHELLYVQKPKLERENLQNLYYNMLIPAANMYAETQFKGVRIDTRKYGELALKWIPKMHGLETELVLMARDLGYPGLINLKSPKQLSNFLYQILGLPGGPSTDIDHLNTLNHEFVDKLIIYRLVQHHVDNYVVAIADDIKHDGYVHPSSLLHGTVTGRPSYRNPPVQTITQDYNPILGPELAEFRSIFIPDNDDYVIAELDYAQLEIWMAYGHSHDQQLYTDLTSEYANTGKPNFHSRVAVDILHAVDDHSSAWNSARFRSKKVTFGVMYMEGPNTLSHPRFGIGCSVNEAKLHINNWYKRYSTFKAWQDFRIKQAINDGELTTVFGRKRRLPLMLDDKPRRQAGNYDIQSVGSDYLLTSAIELHNLLNQYDSRILFTVHDSIVLHIAKKYLGQVLALAREIMTQPRIANMPAVNIEAKVGSNWYEVKPV